MKAEKRHCRPQPYGAPRVIRLQFLRGVEESDSRHLFWREMLYHLTNPPSWFNITKNRPIGEFLTRNFYFLASLKVTRLRRVLLYFFSSIFFSTFFLFLRVIYNSPVSLLRNVISLSCDIVAILYLILLRNAMVDIFISFATL